MHCSVKYIVPGTEEVLSGVQVEDDSGASSGDRLGRVQGQAFSARRDQEARNGAVGKRRGIVFILIISSSLANIYVK